MRFQSLVFFLLALSATTVFAADMTPNFEDMDLNTARTVAAMYYRKSKELAENSEKVEAANTQFKAAIKSMKDNEKELQAAKELIKTLNQNLEVKNATIKQLQQEVDQLKPRPPLEIAKSGEKDSEAFLDGTKVNIVRSKISMVPLVEEFTGQESGSDTMHLIIELKIQNITETRKIDYLSWRRDLGSLQSNASLTDNFGNRYRYVEFVTKYPKGAVKSVSIYPGNSITDVLVFELPISKATSLKLKLPGENVGATSNIELTLPNPSP